MQNRLSTFFVVALAPVLTVACANEKLNESIEFANKAVRAQESGNGSEAVEFLERSVAAYRDNHQSWYTLGIVHEGKREWAEAVKSYGEAARVKDDSEMYHYKLGKSYSRWGKVSQAQTSLERAIDLNPNLYGAHFELGVVHERLGDPKSAAQSWTQSAKLAPHFGKAFIQLGMLYVKWDKLDEAIAVLEVAHVHAVNADDVTEIYYNLGLAYEKQGNWDKAIESYTSAITARPGNLEALLQRGFAYAEKKDVANAKKDLKKFVEAGAAGKPQLKKAANQRLYQL